MIFSITHFQAFNDDICMLDVAEDLYIQVQVPNFTISQLLFGICNVWPMLFTQSVKMYELWGLATKQSFDLQSCFVPHCKGLVFYW